MTTRYELRPTANANGNYLDVFIQGVPTSAGCEARVPLRTGREEHCREFAEHIVNLLNADVLEQARRANGAKNEERDTGSGERVNPCPSTRPPHPAPRTPTPDERWQQC